MIKEIILVAAVILSLILAFIAIPKIGKLGVSKSNKLFLTYLTILFPIIGYLVVGRIKSKQV
jgi:hypothetical protein